MKEQIQVPLMLRVRTGATDNTLYQQSSRPDHMPERRVYRRVHQKEKRESEWEWEEETGGLDTVSVSAGQT